MKSLLCPTCGCSLVRLGVSRENAARAEHDGAEYLFCCEGCRELFGSDPERYLAEIRDVVVCPSCLAEKPIAVTVAIEHNGTTCTSAAARVARRHFELTRTDCWRGLQPKTVHRCGCPGGRAREDAPRPLG